MCRHGQQAPSTAQTLLQSGYYLGEARRQEPGSRNPHAPREQPAAPLLVRSGIAVLLIGAGGRTKPGLSERIEFSSRDRRKASRSPQCSLGCDRAGAAPMVPPAHQERTEPVCAAQRYGADHPVSATALRVNGLCVPREGIRGAYLQSV